MPAAERAVALDAEAFAAEGQEIAQAITAGLPGRAVVHDEAAAQRAGWDVPRWAFEYAV